MAFFTNGATLLFKRRVPPNKNRPIEAQQLQERVMSAAETGSSIKVKWAEAPSIKESKAKNPKAKKLRAVLNPIKALGES